MKIYRDLLTIALLVIAIFLFNAKQGPDKNVLTFTLVKDGVYKTSSHSERCFVKVLEIVGRDSIVKNINVPEKTYRLLTGNLEYNQTGDKVIFQFAKNGKMVGKIKGKIVGSFIITNK